MKALEGVEIEETTDYKDEVLSIKQITLTHIKKISNMICQELTPGFWEKKPMKVGSGIVMIENYKPDLRVGYCNAIDFLTDIVYPYADEDFQKIADEIYDKEDKKEPEIKEKIKIRRKLFRQMNIMFERFNYFDSTSGVSEGV